MGFLYEMFHIPRTLDEAINRIKIYGYERVDVYLRYNELMIDNGINAKNHVLEYGVRFSKHLKWIARKSYVSVDDKVATFIYMDNAIKLAHRLALETLVVTINNEPIGRMYQKANFLASRIEAERRERSIP